MSLTPNLDNRRCLISCRKEKVEAGECVCHNRVSGNYTKEKFAISSLNPEKDWKGDWRFENGNYFCTCMFCKELFTGHKRRVVCRLCAIEQGYIPEDNNDLI